MQPSLRLTYQNHIVKFWILIIRILQLKLYKNELELKGNFEACCEFRG